MRSFQKRVIKRMEQVAAEQEVELIHQSRWGNTGEILRIGENDEEVLGMDYNFQDEYCTLRFSQGQKTYWYKKKLAKLMKDAENFVKYGKPFYTD
jgi:NH3-dependent NAD+ synthetase